MGFEGFVFVCFAADKFGFFLADCVAVCYCFEDAFEVFDAVSDFAGGAFFGFGLDVFAADFDDVVFLGVSEFGQFGVFLGLFCLSFCFFSALFFLLFAGVVDHSAVSAAEFSADAFMFEGGDEDLAEDKVEPLVGCFGVVVFCQDLYGDVELAENGEEGEGNGAVKVGGVAVAACVIVSVMGSEDVGSEAVGECLGGDPGVEEAKCAGGLFVDAVFTVGAEEAHVCRSAAFE